eukprot:1158764-Pelagomonas_calceolata.AAC.1
MPFQGARHTMPLVCLFAVHVIWRPALQSSPFPSMPPLLLLLCVYIEGLITRDSLCNTPSPHSQPFHLLRAAALVPLHLCSEELIARCPKPTLPPRYPSRHGSRQGSRNTSKRSLLASPQTSVQAPSASNGVSSALVFFMRSDELLEAWKGVTLSCACMSALAQCVFFWLQL